MRHSLALAASFMMLALAGSGANAAIGDYSTGDYIVGGEPVPDADAYPWQVRLFSRPGDPQSGFCGGSFISDQWVLTAAHCVFGLSKIADQLAIGYGSVYQTKLKLVDLDKIIIHPDYAKTRKSDLALIKLKAPVEDATWVDVADPAAEAKYAADGKPIVVTGWGALWDKDAFASAMSAGGGFDPKAVFGSNKVFSPDQLRKVELQRY
jgi:hypothetical protein